MIARRHDDHALVRRRPSSRRGRVRRTGAAPSASECLRPVAHCQSVLPGRRIDGERLATRVATVNSSPVRVERRRAIILVLAVLAGVPLPRDLERIEVAGVDLVERRIARAPRVGAPVAPFAGLVAAHHCGALLGVRLRRVRTSTGRNDQPTPAVAMPMRRATSGQPVVQRRIMASPSLRWK